MSGTGSGLLSSTGLEDAEYFWEPVADCWSVRQATDGRWLIDGAGGDVVGRAAP